MSLFDTIKNALVEEDAPHVTPVDKKVETKKSPATITIPATNPTQTTMTSGKMKDILLSGLASSLAGSPYLNFQNMNNKMKLKIADTSTRLSAISASMEVQGITKQAILDGANNAVAFLNNESNTFQSELESNLQRLEQGYKNKTDNISSLLEQKQNQIKVLSEEISNLQKEKSTTDIQAQEEKTQLEVSRIEFSGSLNSIVQEIRNDINDINLNLGV